MSESISSNPTPVNPSPVIVPISHSASAHRADPPPRNGCRPTSPLQIAVPASGSAPGFASIYTLAVTSANLDQEVLVVCLTGEALADWSSQLQERTQPIDGLAVVDGQFGWSINWRAFFSQKVYDITMMHGLHTALREHSIPVSYAKRLVDSVPRGLIVLA